jgi:predicted nucleic acid-binding protein
VRFWDSSAIVPLLVGEPATDAMIPLAAADPGMLVWWATEVECVSAIARLERDGDLSSAAAQTALDRLDAAADGWSEVQAGELVRRSARRLLRTHSLRAADALQLGAAMAAAEGDATSLEMVTLDDRLGAVARREGFVVRGV